MGDFFALLWPDAKACCFIELAFNFQQAIIFADAVRPCRRAGFDLPCIERHCDICYGSILRLSASVGKDRAISVSLRKAHSLHGFAEGTDLIRLD